jgi:hypothetical protein
MKELDVGVSVGVGRDFEVWAETGVAIYSKDS